MLLRRRSPSSGEEGGGGGGRRLLPYCKPQRCVRGIKGDVHRKNLVRNKA